MARKKATPTIVNLTPEPLAPALQESAEAANVLAAVQANYNDERDLLNQLLGQAQMADAFARFSVTVTTSKLAFVKENKLYRALKGIKSGHGDQLLDGTWDEFCRLIGRSREHVERDIANLRSFGEEALESMSRMGIGYRELRQFRRLPDDQKSALIEVARSGDKDSFLELAEDLIAKHAKEKDALTKAVEAIAADKEASERVAQGKEETINKLQREVIRLSKPLAVVPWDERVAPFQKEITERQSLLDAAIGQHKKAVEALDAWLTTEITSQPDYDPEAPVALPPPVRAVLLHLDDAVNRTASLAAGLQHELRLRFGGDIADARRHVLDADA